MYPVIGQTAPPTVHQHHSSNKPSAYAPTAAPQLQQDSTPVHIQRCWILFISFFNETPLDSGKLGDLTAVSMIVCD